jgi:hypothetical protein
MAKAEFNRKNALFTRKRDLNLRSNYRRATIVAQHCMVLKMDISEKRSEIPGKFQNVVLEKDGKDQLDRSREKRRSTTQSQGEKEYPTYNEKKEG